ncbi:hypothetical protein NKG94_08765 [Micromonospora sp. M12]
MINVLNPLLFLIGIGAGLGALVDDNAPTQIAGVSYAAFFAPGMLAAAAMQNAFLEGPGSGPCRRLRRLPQRHPDAAAAGAARRRAPALHHLPGVHRQWRLHRGDGGVRVDRGWWALGALLGATLTGSRSRHPPPRGQSASASCATSTRCSASSSCRSTCSPARSSRSRSYPSGSDRCPTCCRCGTGGTVPHAEPPDGDGHRQLRPHRLPAGARDRRLPGRSCHLPPTVAPVTAHAPSIVETP